MALSVAYNLNIPATNAFNWCTIRGKARGQGKHIRQTSGSNSFGVVELSLEPYEGTSQLLLEWQVPKAQIPLEFLPGVVTGMRLAAQKSRAEHCPLTGIKVTVLAGKYHEVDSHNNAYQLASTLAFQEALRQMEILSFQPELTHLARQQQAIAAWNIWRASEPHIQPDLSGADLSSVSLSEALLRQSKLAPINLSQVDPQKVNLVEANLSNVNLSAANLSGADLALLNLSRAILTGANLRSTSLIGTKLSGANLSGATFAGATFAATALDNALLTGIDLRRADMRQISLYRKNLQGANLEGASLENASLSEIDLSRANLHQACLAGAELYGVDLSEANLSEADLRAASLHRVNLSRTNLQSANLIDVHLKEAQFYQTDLRGIPWPFIMLLTFQADATWQDVLYDHPQA